ncbi:SQSTM1.2 family protein [Megaselia abdita]
MNTSGCIKVFFSESENFKHFYVDCTEFSELYAEILKSLTEFGGNKQVRIFWIDKEGDEIAIDNDSSYKVFRKQNPNNLRVYCEFLRNIKTIDGKFVHLRVNCDECNAKPIVGSRFKCLQCPDFDLCSTCEADQCHGEHNFVKYSEKKSSLESVVVFLNESSNFHQRITCNNCGISPIHGFRYKCITCPDYDLCWKCQLSNVHSEHTLIRTQSSQTISKVCL